MSSVELKEKKIETILKLRKLKFIMNLAYVVSLLTFIFLIAFFSISPQLNRILFLFILLTLLIFLLFIRRNVNNLKSEISSINYILSLKKI